MPHLVKDYTFECSLLLHAGHVVDVEGHLSGVADAAAVVPDAPWTGEAEGSRRAVDGFKGRTDAELAGRTTVGVGAGAGDVGQDFSPPGTHRSERRYKQGIWDSRRQKARRARYAPVTSKLADDTYDMTRTRSW